ncbi:hypothetical protein [Xylella fastidiosa]|uniref:Uncharacterized protein n=1 Tax=Xylella fastidiosa subsp. sandyi Ann-1 TaxID=155920 RepID=A0A060H3W9_XYLFS|nr:hypothetical protein [Xylella fastidiosa]AIC11449.1 hypothetical protein D934_09330 [Xylella fastidiosa subsp. sandyi Ann-1]UIX80465.1 hypothetical protein LZ756_08050 [Xylella fastidiosa subsp. sandyi]
MLKVATCNPHEGMSFKSLGDQSEVSSASKVSVTDQEGTSHPSSGISLLFSGIEEIVKDLILAEKKLQELDFQAFDIEMFQARRHISSAILDAEIKLFHLSQDIKSVHIQCLIKALRHV